MGTTKGNMFGKMSTLEEGHHPCDQ